MMKRAYIKPEMEILDGELTSILCASTSGYNAKVDNQPAGDNNNDDDDDLPTGGARGFNGDFGFDE